MAIDTATFRGQGLVVDRAGPLKTLYARMPIEHYVSMLAPFSKRRGSVSAPICSGL